MNADTARLNYLKWLSAEHPDVFARVKNTLRPGLGSLGWIAALANAVIQAGTVVLQKKQADKQLALAKKAQKLSDAQAAQDRADQMKLALLDVNTKRAQAGLGPVDMNGNAIQSQALATPAALASVITAKSAGIPNYVWIGGAGLLVVGFLFLRSK